MNFTCRNCNSLVVVMPGDRPPPWCSKCGADFKSDDPQFLALSASLDSERVPVPTVRSRPKVEPLPDEELAKAAPVAEPTPARAREEGPDPITRWLLVAGAALLVVSLVLGAEVWTFVKNGQSAGGQVKVMVQADSLSLGITRTEKVIQYQANGSQYEIPAGGREEGERVSLIYRTDDPHDARINATMTLYRWPLLLGGAALMLLISGLVLASLTSGAPEKSALAANSP
jgi:hypothetical protein